MTHAIDTPGPRLEIGKVFFKLQRGLHAGRKNRPILITVVFPHRKITTIARTNMRREMQPITHGQL